MDNENLLKEIEILKRKEKEYKKIIEIKTKELNHHINKTKELEGIIFNSPVILFLWQNKEGWPVEFVSNNISQFGYSQDDFYSGRVPYATIIHPSDLSRVAKEVEYYSKNKFKTFKQKYRIYSKDNTIHWIDDRTLVRYDKDGEITHYQGIILDITKEEVAQEKIIFQKNYLRTILDTGQNIIITTLEGQKIVDANKAFFNFFNKYNNLKEFHKDYNCISDLFERVDEKNYLYKEINGIGWTNYILQNQNIPHKVLIKKDNQNFIFSVTANKMNQDTNGRVVVNFTDITMLEEYKNNLEERVKKQIEKNRENEQILIQQSKLASLGEMLGAIAHQWRQPLNAVAMNIELLLETYDNGELTEKYLKDSVDKSMKQIKFMSNTINDFKNFFKPIEKDSIINLKKVIVDAYNLLSAQLKSHNVKFNLKIDDNNLSIKGNTNQFRQTLLNIFINAKDAIEEQREKGVISAEEEGVIDVEVKRYEKEVIVNIWDNGGEVSKEIIEKMFNPYFSTKNEAKGTGIGLYMSKIIIEKNFNGSISVKNRDGGLEVQIRILNGR